MNKPSRIPILGLAAAIAVLLGIVAGSGWFAPKPRTLASGTLLPKPRPVAEFALTGEDGKPFTRADLQGHWTVIFVGYTSCPDVCPTMLAELKAMKAQLGADTDRLGVLFISADPERDTPDKLAGYVHYFDPRFRAATGPVADLERLGANLGFVFQKSAGTSGSYTIDHSAALMLVDPQAQLAGYLVPPFTPAALATDMKNIIEGRTS